ncbi:Neutral and basic amino acid transport protein rBAT [Taenia solium]
MSAKANKSGEWASLEKITLPGKDKDIAAEAKNGDNLLTKEDLLKIDREEPIWRWVRIAIIVLFWTVWVSFLVASILCIVFTPKCPPRPKQTFWQSKVGYWVNLLSFKDSNGDAIGDLQGLTSSIDHIQMVTNSGFVILTSLFPNYLADSHQLGNVSFERIHPALGTMADFDTLLRALKKRGMQVVISLNFNAIPLNHELANPDFLAPATDFNEFCRFSSMCSIETDDKRFYSLRGVNTTLVKLNLLSPELIKEIKKATLFWLSKGVDGILLDDAAFFVEEHNNCSSALWLSEFPTCKLYTNGTISVIQELRKVLDEVSTETSRPRVLIANPGHTGYGAIKAGIVESLLGTEDAPGAHLVITREFASNRGFLLEQPQTRYLRYYLDFTNSSLRNQLALVLASPSDRPYISMFSVAWIFCSRIGTPVIYAGTEVGCYLYNSTDFPGTNYSLESFNIPMPWDYTGVGFSTSEKAISNYRFLFTKYELSDTVESVQAFGHEPSIFNLTTSLVQLRREYPSLLWGSLIYTPLNYSETPLVEVFKRSATGFDSIIVVTVRDFGRDTVINFSSECSVLVPLLVYPPNDAFKVGVETSNLKVYFKPFYQPSLYVFRCIA